MELIYIKLYNLYTVKISFDSELRNKGLELKTTMSIHIKSPKYSLNYKTCTLVVGINLPGFFKSVGYADD